MSANMSELKNVLINLRINDTFSIRFIVTTENNQSFIQYNRIHVQ